MIKKEEKTNTQENRITPHAPKRKRENGKEMQNEANLSKQIQEQRHKQR